MKAYYFILLSVITLVGCDPNFYHRFLIKNETTEKISVQFKSHYGADTGFAILPDSTCVLHQEKIIGTFGPLVNGNSIFYDYLRLYLKDSLVFSEPPFGGKLWTYHRIPFRSDTSSPEGFYHIHTLTIGKK